MAKTAIKKEAVREICSPCANGEHIQCVDWWLDDGERVCECDVCKDLCNELCG